MKKTLFNTWIPWSTAVIYVGIHTKTLRKYVNEFKTRRKDNPYDPNHKLYFREDIETIKNYVLKEKPYLRKN